MSGATRLGDNVQGLSVSRQVVSGSEDTYINGRRAARFGDKTADGHIINGSRGVFVNGRPLARAGDAVVCGHESGVLAEGSRDVVVCDFAQSSDNIKPRLWVQLLHTDGTPMSSEAFEVIDSQGHTIFLGTTNEQGELTLDEVEWGTYEIKLSSGRIIQPA